MRLPVQLQRAMAAEAEAAREARAKVSHILQGSFQQWCCQGTLQPKVSLC